MQNGKTRKPKSKHLTSEQLAEIKRMYPDTPNEEIAETLGLSVWTIRARAQKHKWHKSKEFISRQNQMRAVKCGNAARINTAESYAKRVVTMQKKMESDRLRIKWGLEPKTKRHYRLEPRGKLLQRNRLQRLGYIVDEKTLVAYYTPGTHRASRLEAVPRGTTKGSIHSYYDFRPYDGTMD